MVLVDQLRKSPLAAFSFFRLSKFDGLAHFYVEIAKC